MRCVSHALLLALACLLSGCMIGRWYIGSPVAADPHELIVAGATRVAEVLRTFGPPDRILRTKEGDVFVYLHEQRNSTSLTIRDPIVTRVTFFEWEKTQDKSDRLMVMFDRAGVVRAFGYRRGRNELEPL